MIPLIPWTNFHSTVRLEGQLLFERRFVVKQSLTFGDDDDGKNVHFPPIPYTSHGRLVPDQRGAR